jgi:hypothetical protein
LTFGRLALFEVRRIIAAPPIGGVGTEINEQTAVVELATLERAQQLEAARIAGNSSLRWLAKVGRSLDGPLAADVTSGRGIFASCAKPHQEKGSLGFC